VGADGDDLAGIPDDEDGVEFITPFTPGANATVKVTASRNNGFLQGWADWNNDGDFNDVGERIITNRLLHSDANLNFVSFAVPANAGAQVYVRFRYGEFANGANAIGTPSGQALTGEVEDYLKTIPVAPAVVAGMPADFDQDEDVDGFDFLAWQRNIGRTGGATQAQGNANGDATVTSGDLHMWKQEFGTVVTAEAAASAALTAGVTGDLNGDQLVDGHDFLIAQRNFGVTVGHGGEGNVGTLGTPSMAQNSTGNSVVMGAVGNGLLGANVLQTAGNESLLADAASQWIRLGGDSDADGLTAVRGRGSVRTAFENLVADASVEPLADYTFLRRDRAFEDLLGSRRRQGLLADGAEAADVSVEDCDELFAALADHGQWPLD
jgi:hypothetical protein